MDIIIKNITLADLSEAMLLAKGVFDEFQAPSLSPEGIAEFHKYIEVNRARLRLNTNHFSLMAIKNKKVVGIIEVRNAKHISLLFVDPNYHNQGIAKKLWTESMKLCKKTNPNITEFTVLASAYALPVYEKWGFKKTAEEQIKNGIRCYPMKLTL